MSEDNFVASTPPPVNENDKREHVDEQLHGGAGEDDMPARKKPKLDSPLTTTTNAVIKFGGTASTTSTTTTGGDLDNWNGESKSEQQQKEDDWTLDSPTNNGNSAGVDNNTNKSVDSYNNSNDGNDEDGWFMGDAGVTTTTASNVDNNTNNSTNTINSSDNNNNNNNSYNNSNGNVVESNNDESEWDMGDAGVTTTTTATPNTSSSSNNNSSNNNNSNTNAVSTNDDNTDDGWDMGDAGVTTTTTTTATTTTTTLNVDTNNNTANNDNNNNSSSSNNNVETTDDDDWGMGDPGVTTASTTTATTAVTTETKASTVTKPATETKELSDFWKTDVKTSDFWKTDVNTSTTSATTSYGGSSFDSNRSQGFRSDGGYRGGRGRRGPEFKIHISRLDFSATARDIEDFFTNKGLTVVDSVVIKDKVTEASRGFGFASFGTQEELNKALDMGSGEIAGRTAFFQPARPRDGSSAGTGAGAGSGDRDAGRDRGRDYQSSTQTNSSGDSWWNSTGSSSTSAPLTKANTVPMTFNRLDVIRQQQQQQQQQQQSDVWSTDSRMGGSGYSNVYGGSQYSHMQAPQQYRSDSGRYLPDNNLTGNYASASNSFNTTSTQSWRGMLLYNELAISVNIATQLTPHGEPLGGNQSLASRLASDLAAKDMLPIAGKGDPQLVVNSTASQQQHLMLAITPSNSASPSMYELWEKVRSKLHTNEEQCFVVRTSATTRMYLMHPAVPLARRVQHRVQPAFNYLLCVYHLKY